MRFLLQKYDLPDAFEIMQRTPSKSSWKKMLDDSVDKHLAEEWNQNLQNKSSTSYLQIPTKPTQETHQVWKTVPNNTRSTKKANIKVKILTGTYTLQSNRARYNQHSVPATCPYCKLGDEDRLHLLLQCNNYQKTQRKTPLNPKTLTDYKA